MSVTGVKRRGKKIVRNGLQVSKTERLLCIGKARQILGLVVCLPVWDAVVASLIFVRPAPHLKSILG